MMETELMIEVPSTDVLMMREEDILAEDDVAPSSEIQISNGHEQASVQPEPQQEAVDQNAGEQQSTAAAAAAAPTAADGAPAVAAAETGGGVPDAGAQGAQGAAVSGAEQGEQGAGNAAAASVAEQPAGNAAAASASAAAAAGAAAEGDPAAAAAAAAGEGPAEEEDELAANLLSNMAAWQSELDTFQAALRRCMESTPVPLAAAAGSPSGVDETGRGAARLQHSGPKGITGFRGVTQHKRTKRYEANVWMDHKQMYLGAFDAPEQAAHAHDIGALCSGKARAEALNFPLTDYDALLPMLYSLPHAQIVSSLRGYGRLPTARPPGGISSGRILSSPSVRSASGKDEDEDYEEGAAAPIQRPRRTRKTPSASPGGSRGLPAAAPTPAAEPMDWQAALQLPAAAQQLTLQALHAQIKQEGGLASSFAASPALQQQLQQQPFDGVLLTTPEDILAAAAEACQAEPQNGSALAVAQQAQLQALSAALMGSLRPPSALSGAPPAGASSEGRPPTGRPAKKAGGGVGLSGLGSTNHVGDFESVLWKVMADSHMMSRPEDTSGEGGALRPLHSGPKGQSGFKGVTLYKRCQRYNAHIWLGKQTHIGTFHTAAQAAVAHDVMELWRNENAQGLNFASGGYSEMLPLLKALSEADALAALRNYSRSPSAAAAAAASGANLATSRPPKQLQRTSSGRTTSAAAAAAAAVAASSGPNPAMQPPSLRRRHRKPQHIAAGGSGEAEESSGGSVPAAGQRQSAGSLMWYMLEQEKSADDDLEEEMSDPDFSPAEAAMQGGKRQRGGSESPSTEPLGFHPRSSASIARALTTGIPEDQGIVGARPPRAGSSHRWGVAVSLRGQAAWFGRLDRQRAAVAADLALLWRRTALSAAGDEDDKDISLPYNVPSAEYDQDPVLMEQIKRIKSAPQLAQFLSAVVPQDPPAPPGGAAAAAAAAAVLTGSRLLAAAATAVATSPLTLVSSAAVAAAAAPAGIARKRKQQTLLEEARASKLQALAGSGPAAPGVLPGTAGGAVAAVAPSRLAVSSTTAASAANGHHHHHQQAAAQAEQQQQLQQGQEVQQQADGVLGEAAAAVQEADMSDSDSMLRALRLLVACGAGGVLLQDVVSGWESYPPMQQQDLFDALKLPISSGDWEQVEERLQVTLDLASLF